MLHDLILIFFCWFLSTIWVLISAPYLLRFTKKYFIDGGWGVTRVVSWLGIALPVWYLAHLGFPINTRVGVWSIFLIALGCAGYIYNRHSKEISTILYNKRKLIVVEELLFVFGFFFLSFIRAYNPEINSLEKFMDGGLIISYLKSPTLPIEDMWLAGSTFNYYTFGHFMGAIATNFWGIDATISYNILLGLLMGMTLQLSFAFIVNVAYSLFKDSPNQKSFLSRIPLLRSLSKNSNRSPLFVPVVIGLIGAYLVVFAGNTQAIWYLFAKCYSAATKTEVSLSPASDEKPSVATNCSFVGYWYPNATRFIPRTIHEFPSYSFIVSDLHAHVWNLVNVFLLLHLILIWGTVLFEKKDDNSLQLKKMKPLITISLIMGVVMGVFLMTSTWDGLVYALLLSLLSTLLFSYQLKLFPKIFISGAIIFLTMIIASSPWWLHFQSISDGIGVAKEHTIWWQLVVLWIGHVTMGLVGASLALLSIRKQKNPHFSHFFILALVLTGICLLILPEIMYIKDIYTTQPRANTMFKLTYQGFILLSLVAALALGMLQNRFLEKRKIAGLLTYVLTLIILGLAIYPYFGYRDYYLGTPIYKGLDGIQWLKTQNPYDYDAYLWLKQVEGRPHILEAVGDSYTTFDRMSTFTGLPTVLGWRVHEWLWRGSYDIPGKRSTEVENMYLYPNSAGSQQLLNQYKVKYIIVGDKEREAYPKLDEAQLKTLGKLVFQSGTTYIIER